MTDRDTLRSRLDAVEEDLADPSGFEFTITWVDDGAETGATILAGDADPDPRGGT